MVPDQSLSDRGLWVRRCGSGDRVLVLLHGMGANGAVWSRLLPILDSRWSGRVLIADLRGHGCSVHQGPYGIDTHAADIAALIAGEAARSVILVGHSTAAQSRHSQRAIGSGCRRSTSLRSA